MSVADGGAEGVSGQVVYDLSGIPGWGFVVNHPVALFFGGDQRVEVRWSRYEGLPAAFEQAQKAFLKFAAELVDIQQPTVWAVVPVRFVVGQAAAGDHAVDMRMQPHVTAPAVQRRQHPGRAVARLLEQGRRGFLYCLEQNVVEYHRSGEDDRVEGVGQREHVVVVVDAEQFALALLEPPAGADAVAGRAVVVVVGVVGGNFVVAVGTLVYVSP